MTAGADSETVELISLNDVRTGDVLFMNRQCLAMRDPIGIGLCLLTKTENRFDHVGMFVKASDNELTRYPEANRRIGERSPSGTYILETNMKGVTLYSAEQRISRSSANEMATRSIILGQSSTPVLQDSFMRQLESMYAIPYQSDLACIAPSVFSPPDKMDRIEAAHKINALGHEVKALERMATASPQRHHVYEQLAGVYARTQLAMLELYFPHLPRWPVDEPASVDWTQGHYVIDGVNQSPRMVCTELVTNLWQRVGLTNGYAPASSMRPFDLMDNSRFNFIDPSHRFGDMRPVKVSSRTRAHWQSGGDTGVYGKREDRYQRSHELTEDARLAFYNAVMSTCKGVAPVRSIDEAAEISGGSFAAILPASWVVQSTVYGEVVTQLWFRTLACGVLFSACTFACAPLTLRWMESQAGLFLVRGSLWSLACWVVARDLTFAAVQAAVIAGGVKLFLRPSVMDAAGPRSLSSLVDTRHPYYTVVGALTLSSLLAHVVTTPIMNANLCHHFGPLRPSPMPLRALMRGALVLSPFSLMLPFQACWLATYETATSFVIPVRSSVLRPRPELLEDSSWLHFRNDALAGAFGITLALDAILYPLQVRVARSLMRTAYAPQPSPSFGRRLFPGYRYRCVSNVLVMGMTALLLHASALI